MRNFEKYVDLLKNDNDEEIHFDDDQNYVQISWRKMNFSFSSLKKILNSMGTKDKSKFIKQQFKLKYLDETKFDKNIDYVVDLINAINKFQEDNINKLYSKEHNIEFTENITPTTIVSSNIDYSNIVNIY